MSPWGQGRATVDQRLASGQLERVPPNRVAPDALHAANRKALTAVLLVQGLRPTRDARHTGVFEAVRAQLQPPLGPPLAPYTRIRRARNAGDYLDELPATADDIAADLPLCRAIVETAVKVVDQMPPY